MPDLPFSIPHSLLPAAILILSLLMGWRDIRTREVLDRELAWLACMTVLLRLTEGTKEFLPLTGPLWLIQYLTLFQTASGALLLAGLSLLTRWIAGRQLIGSGDIFFMLASGFMLTPQESLAAVGLAFLLAFPFSLYLFLFKRKAPPLPFLPFLFLALVMVKWGPPSLRLCPNLLK